MANEYIAQLFPRDFFRESSTGDTSMYSTWGGANAGGTSDLFGLVLTKHATQGYTALVPISHANTFTTGLTFTLFLVDDAQDAADLGKVVRIGITVKTVVDAETVDLDTAAATETTQDCTLKSTSNQILVQTVAIANAALDSLASGQAMAIRIRRIGTHANDTCNGRALLLGVSVKNT